MRVMIDITDEDISYAEGVLLKDDQHFDEERRVFIRNLDTLDLQAVPGSGKTTALLAKLLILERYMPLENGAGILVISHTNTAVDEIRNRIGKYCPKLFRYPNFIGTIQSFVDTHLAIPFYLNKFKTKPFRIDNEIYYETVEKYFSFNLNGFTKQEQKNARYYLIGMRNLHTYRIGILRNQLILLDSINGKNIIVKKPRRGKSWVDFSDCDKLRIEKWLIKFKLGILGKGILHFDDAYMLAEMYLIKFPNLKKILQKRFRYVFVDEMQDMDVHQYLMLEKIFYDGGNSLSKFQRIGDINQAIFSGSSIHTDKIWIQRDNTLYLNGSHRINSILARLVQNLALTGNGIIGRYENGDGTSVDIKPHIILFDDDSKTRVIGSYAAIIKRMQNEGKISKNPNHKFMAIAWRKEHEAVDKIGLSDYWTEYSNSNNIRKIDYKVLKDYLLFTDLSIKSLGPVRDNILNAFLKILRIENNRDNNSRIFTKITLLNFLKDEHFSEFDNFKDLIYKWSFDLVQRKVDVVYDCIKAYIPEFLEIFGGKVIRSNEFISGNSEINVELLNDIEKSNTFELDDIKIEIGTVHSAKGQTHTATLYLETFFSKGYGNYESERLRNQFLGENIVDTMKRERRCHDKFIKTTKMAYVGFSRPTHLLCVAIHKERFDKFLTGINKDYWEIVDI